MLRSFRLALILLLLLAPSAYCREITLEWDPNTEPDVVGYKVYYKGGSPSLPLDGVGAAEGPSPIDVRGATRATLRGLEGGQVYYFAVTAYNSAGYESSFSSIIPSDWVPVPTLPENGAVTSSEVHFAWTPSPPDLPVTYTLYYGTEPSLASAPPPEGTFSPVYLLAPPAIAAALLLLFYLPVPRRRPLVHGAALSLCALLMASCGGGGGGTEGRAAPLGENRIGPFQGVIHVGNGTTAIVQGLQPGTTYYWKVVASEGQKRRESITQSFTVHPPGGSE